MDTPKGLIHRLTHLSPDAVPTDDDEVDGEAADEVGCWGWLRGVRDRAQMIELRKKDGRIMSVGYGWLDRAEFDPTEGITLYVAGREITIKGRNLDFEVRPCLRLFTALSRHRCLWLREATQEELMQSPAKAMLIESISWE